MTAEMLYAGFWKRLMALILDQIILTLARVLIAAILFLIIHGLLQLTGAQPATRTLVWMIAIGCGILFNFWATWLYFALMESSSSRATLGKMALGIKVVGLEGEAVTFEKATARYFSKIVSGLLLLIGFLMIAFSSRKQGLHDLMTRCLVVDRFV